MHSWSLFSNDQQFTMLYVTRIHTYLCDEVENLWILDSCENGREVFVVTRRDSAVNDSDLHELDP